MQPTASILWHRADTIEFYLVLFGLTVTGYINGKATKVIGLHDTTLVDSDDYEVICNALNNAKYIYVKFFGDYDLIIIFKDGVKMKFRFNDGAIKHKGRVYRLKSDVLKRYEVE